MCEIKREREKDREKMLKLDRYRVLDMYYTNPRGDITGIFREREIYFSTVCVCERQT